MKIERVRCCSKCGHERPRDTYCISCNSVGRKTKIRFRFMIGWRRPEIGEFDGVPLHERERINVPPDPPFDER